MSVWESFISIALFKALALTLTCELLVLVLFRVDKKILLVGFILNIFSNISMNLLIGTLNPINYDLFVLFCEVIVVIIEFCIYYLFMRDGKKALLISFLANFASYIMGMLLMNIIY